MNIDFPIPVQTQEWETGNLKPVLHELKHALQRLLETGEETTLDLRALPFTSGELTQLEAFLGVGEVSATLDALGESLISETSYPGIWILTHYDADHEITGKLIEVTRIPTILKSQESEMAEALHALSALLADQNKLT